VFKPVAPRCRRLLFLNLFNLPEVFDMGTFAYCIDANNDGLLDGSDTLVTSVASLVPDTSVDLTVTATAQASEVDGTQSANTLTPVTTANITIT